MAKASSNHRSAWTKANVAELRKLANQNTPTRVLALKTGRTEAAVRNKAHQEDISLKPTNQSPYGSKASRRK